MNIKLLYYRIIYKYFHRFAGPYTLNKVLRLQGIEVGEGTIFYGNINIDRQRQWMLKIGKYCKITHGVTILTHDYSRSVLRRAYGEIIGEAGQTIIGDNCFIGMNAIILMGTKIGNNCIVGAGSVVGGVFPDNVVIAGNPARIIRTLDEHYQIRKRKCLKEAELWFDTFKERYGRWPSENESGPFFPLFTDRKEFDYENDRRLMCNGDNIDDIIADFKTQKPMFESYNNFIEHLNNRSI